MEIVNKELKSLMLEAFKKTIEKFDKNNLKINKIIGSTCYEIGKFELYKSMSINCNVRFSLYYKNNYIKIDEKQYYEFLDLINSTNNEMLLDELKNELKTIINS